MTAGLGRGAALVGIGLAVGLAVVAALFGTGDLLKRLRGPATPGEPSRSIADLPAGGNANPGKPLAKGDKPRADAGDQAAIDPNGGPLAGSDGSSRADAHRGATAAPSLDILRVEPSGEAVLAGRGAPKAAVELLRDNETVARATADESGQFAIDSLTLPPGNSELTLRSTTPDGKTIEGKASAVVVIDKDRTARPLVAVSEPDRPTRVLSMPSASAARTAEADGDAVKDPGKDLGRDPAKDRVAPAGAGGTKAEPPPRREAALPGAGGKPAAAASEPAAVKIVSVDAQEGGRLFVSGQGAAWTSLRLYLNDTLVASGRSGADGRVSFTIGRGVKPGGYQIRIDQVDETSGKVGQRAQVGFNFPTQLAAKEPAKEPAREPVRTAAKPSPTAPAKPEAQAARRSEKPAATPPAAPKPPVAEAPAVAAGSARPNPAATPPETGKRTVEALSPQPPEAGPAAGSGAGPSDGPREGPRNDPREGRNPPTNPPDAPPRLAERPPATPQGPDMAVPMAVPAAPAPTPTDQAATVFVPEIDTARITRGDNLWQISRRSYGDGRRYTVIYDANRDQIRDPNLIYPGQIFVMPKDGPAAGGQGAKRG